MGARVTESNVAERVLVIDDDPDALALIRLMLRRRGYEVETAPGGVEALEFLAANELPDLILLDLMMPFMDGHEVCTRLRADPRTASLPVIVLTAKSQVSSRMEAMELGADDYIVKPVHPDELTACIRHVLERKTQARPAPKGALIGCVGCKGGVGTTLAVNAALMLATRGRVVLADFSGDALVYLGYSPLEWPTVLSQLDLHQVDRHAIEQAWKPHSDTLYLLYETDMLASQARADAVFNRLTDIVDFGLLDLGPWTLAGWAHQRWLVETCQAMVLVVASDQVAVTRTQGILRQWAAWRLTLPIYLVMRTFSPRSAQAEAAGLSAQLGREIDYILPYSPQPMIRSSFNGPQSEVLQALADALARVREG